ncbi:hypothetical protein [Bounagaea algeriensis]
MSPSSGQACEVDVVVVGCAVEEVRPRLLRRISARCRPLWQQRL